MPEVNEGPERVPDDRMSSPPDSYDEDDGRLAKKVYAVSVRWEREQQGRRRQTSDPSRPVVENKPFLTFTIEDFNRYFCCCARRVGSMFFLLERRDGSPIVVAGPCWPFCTFVTVPLIVGLSGLVGYFIVSNPNTGLPWWFALIYYPIVVFVLTVLFCVSCRDPGLMERVTDEEAAENGWFWNEQVGSYRPAGAMYCRECKALVHDYDHVCPWTGTAIGKGNMIPFKIFVFSVNVLCYFSVGLVIWQVMDKVT
mmetsp:Transcript_11520/g.24556  ORF Transcript_11520/g.24556 Transcript_11520/m.24556 type:complete len:253 (+) Transcript_11520:158-916(+)